MLGILAKPEAICVLLTDIARTKPGAMGTMGFVR